MEQPDRVDAPVQGPVGLTKLKGPASWAASSERRRRSPRVSVILPAFNEEKYLERAVRSILSQTYRDFELIVLDDGSTDRTWEVLQRFRDPRMLKVRLPHVGFRQALNRGFALARGEYIARMDADDESLPTRLEEQVKFLDANPSIHVLGTAVYLNDALRKERSLRIPPLDDREIRRSFALFIPICHGSVMMRREVLEVVGGYREDVVDAEDLDLWLRAAPHFRFGNLEKPLYVYHFDPRHSFFESRLGRLRRVKNKYGLLRRAVRELDLPRYYYVMAAATFVYQFLLPKSLKRLARRAISKGREVELHGPA